MDHQTQSGDDGRTPEDFPSLEELERLHHLLTPDEREELLECLLISASEGGDGMFRALTPWLVGAAGHELLDGLGT
jgi:hypothetical protein